MSEFEIVKFIQARLAENEAAAKGVHVIDNAPWHLLEWYDGDFEGGETARVDLRSRTGAITDRGALPRPVGAHIVRHDPARVLAEVMAKRERLRLLGIAWNRLQDVQHDPAVGPIEHGDAIGRFVMALRMVALDAAVWRGHPDYRAQWAEPNWRPGS